jgi:hypothetical protein
VGVPALGTDYSRPRKPTDKADLESFNGVFRNECLNAHWFESIAAAKGVVEPWRVEYKESRPHRALGEVPPAEFTRSGGCNGAGSFQLRTALKRMQPQTADFTNQRVVASKERGQ